MTRLVALALVSAGVWPMTGCHRQAFVIDPPVPVVERGRQDNVCAAFAAALNRIDTVSAGGYLVLDFRTKPFDLRRTRAPILNAMQDTPGLAASTWRSFVEQNDFTQPTCPTPPGRMPFVTDSFGEERSNTVWGEFTRRHPKARGAVFLEGLGVSADGKQVFLQLRVAFAPTAGARYRAVVNEQPDRSWRVIHFYVEGLGD